MARKKNKTKPPAAPPKKPPPAPPGLTSSVQDEPSNQPKPTTTTPIPDSVKSECEQALNAQEERRKEMRLLQQKLYAPNPQQDDDRISLESLSGPKIKLANKRKNAELQKMTTDWLQRITSVRKYWNSLSVEKRRSFLEVSFHDLWARYSSEEDVLALGVLSEALSYAEHKKTLKFWVCCCCSSEFKDCESHKQHVLAHISNLEANFQGVLPKEVDSSSVDMILNGCWKPVDLNAAMKILENQATRQSLTTADTINQRWPLVNDPKRAKHLESIQFMFQLLLKNKCLADVHVQTAIQAAMGELENLAPGLELIDHGLDKTPACICFLGADMLPNIFLYLHRLSNLCKLGKDSEKTTSVDDTQGVDALVSDVLEGITLSDDSHHLMLNEFLLTTVTVSNKAENATLGQDGGPDKDEFLYWMFRPSSTDVEPVSWTCKREDRGRRRMEIFEKLKMEIYLLRTLCQDKFTHKCYIEACCTLSRLCDEEIRKRDYSVGYVAQSLESLLRKRYEEIAVREDDPVYERTAISFVLEEYQASNVTSSNREDLRMQDNLDQADDRLLDVIENQKQPSYKEMGNYDAMIMQKLAAMQQLERELEAISAIDYRGIMLFLVKKLLRVCIDLV
ncbi:uncharacterized protein LOC131224032 [Magnolia sinica]|uniref:uncharacterized protein LOC131224032 n=1 Tax=Magnolia sinica TaxID=86752 RepID=UPI002658F543|nr:uncharacterized protein LOC131224032 [Magnolia sinica]